MTPQKSEWAETENHFRSRIWKKRSKRSLLTYFACNKTEWPAQKEENITILTLEPRSDAGMQETQAGDAKSGEKSNQELRGGHCCEARPTSLCRRGLEADWPHHTTPFQSHTWAAALSTTFLAQCSPQTSSCVELLSPSVVLFFPICLFMFKGGTRQYLGDFGTTNKQICTSQSSRAFAGMLNVKWRRANLLSEAWPHMSQDDLAAAVQSWGERWH